jgi:hypothetical protein
VGKNPEALRQLDDASRSFQAEGDAWGEAFALLCIGECARAQGNNAKAEAAYSASLSLWRVTGEVWWQAATFSIEFVW